MNPINILRFNSLLARIRVGAYSSTSIDVKNLGLTNADAKSLIDTIKASKKIRDKITAIDLSYSEHLTELEISGLHNLRSITVDNTNISVLCLHDLPALHRLSAEHSELPAIDLSAVTELECINLAYNKLEFLNIAGFKNLTNAYVQQTTLKTVLIAGSPLYEDFYYNSTNFDPVTLAQLIAHKADHGRTHDFFNLIEQREDDLVLTIEQLDDYCKTIISAFKAGPAQQALTYSARIYAWLRSGEFTKQLSDDLLVKFAVNEGFKSAIKKSLIPNLCFMIVDAQDSARNKLLQQYIASNAIQQINSMCMHAERQLLKQVYNSSSALARAVERISTKQAPIFIAKSQATLVPHRSPLLFRIAKVVMPMVNSKHEKVEHKKRVALDSV